MHIDKFNGVVFINEDHPLAVAQCAKDSADASNASNASDAPASNGRRSADPLTDNAGDVAAETPPATANASPATEPSVPRSSTNATNATASTTSTTTNKRRQKADR